MSASRVESAQSPNRILADIVVVGSVPKGERQSGARVRAPETALRAGALGAATAALKLLFAGRKLRPADFPRHFYPTPRVEVGRFLREKGLASAMIDLSDGLSTDLGHICEESGAGAEIRSDAVPRADIGKPAHQVDLQFALHGGDEYYQLLFTAPSSKRVPSRIADVDITQIGHITRGKQFILMNRGVSGRNCVRKAGNTSSAKHEPEP